VTSSFMSFHIASHTEGLAAPRLWALVGLFASMAMAVDAQAAGSREGFVAS
jgi:hypothetical protein